MTGFFLKKLSSVLLTAPEGVPFLAECFALGVDFFAGVDLLGVVLDVFAMAAVSLALRAYLPNSCRAGTVLMDTLSVGCV